MSQAKKGGRVNRENENVKEKTQQEVVGQI